MTDIELLEERLDALERTVVEEDFDTGELTTSEGAAEDIEEFETQLEALEERVAELEAAIESIEGYVSNVEAVNDDVEQQANAAIAAVDRLEDRIDDLDLSDFEGRVPRQQEGRAGPADTEPDSGGPFDGVAADEWSGEEPAQHANPEAEPFANDDAPGPAGQSESESASAQIRDDTTGQDRSDDESTPAQIRDDTTGKARDEDESTPAETSADTDSDESEEGALSFFDNESSTDEESANAGTTGDPQPSAGAEEQPANTAAGRPDNGAAPGQHRESVDRILSDIDTGSGSIRNDGPVEGNSYSQPVDDVLNPDDEDEETDSSVL